MSHLFKILILYYDLDVLNHVDEGIFEAFSNKLNDKGQTLSELNKATWYDNP